jgi:hypothetical protein
MAFASSTVFVTFTNLNSDVQGNGTTNSQSNTYNGETDTSIAGIPSLVLICDDFSDTTQVPSGPIDFSVNTIASLTASPSNVDFTGGTVPGTGTISQTLAYDTIAVLASEIEQAGNTVQQVTDYQYAIWYLMEPSGVDGNNSSIQDNPLDANATSDLQSAYAAVTAAPPTAGTVSDEQALVIYTPTSQYSSNQEFIGLNTPTSTPEPSTWFLMAAAGLLLCVPRLRARVSALRSRS